MADKSFEIQIQTAEGGEDSVPLESTRRQRAIAEMRRWLDANRPAGNVYLAFRRLSDGQRGYVNQDGSYAVTGTPWTLDRSANA